jgi:hypothetical protein
MAFPATNWFRNTLITGLTLPVTTGSATATVELANATRKPVCTIYTNSLSASANFNTDIGYASPAGIWDTNAEVAASGTYAQGAVTAGILTSPTFALSGNTVLFGPTSSTVSWTSVSWAAGATAGQGCLVWQQPSATAPKYGIAAFLFGTALSPTNGTVTITWTAGILQFS